MVRIFLESETVLKFCSNSHGLRWGKCKMGLQTEVGVDCSPNGKDDGGTVA